MENNYTSIASLDKTTKQLIYFAHIINDRPDDYEVRTKLRTAITAWDTAHEEERARNLINALWPREGKPTP